MGVRLLLLVAAGCGGVPQAQLVRQPPATGEDTPVLAMLGDDLLIRRDGAYERIDADTAAVRWRAEAPSGALWPPLPGARPELWIIGENADAGELLRINSENGLTVGTATLPTGFGKWERAGDTLIRLSQYELAGHDVTDAAPRWKVEGELSEYHHSVSRDAIWIFRGTTLCGFALADGKERGCLPAEAGSAKAVPGGDLVVVRIGAALVAHDPVTLEVAWRTPLTAGQELRDLAVGSEWIVATSTQRTVRNGIYELFALRASDGARIWERASQPGIYFGYLGVAGNLMSWYDSGDTTQWATRLPAGATTQVRQFHKGYVMSTDASGVAPAVPSGDPVISGDHIQITDFGKTWVYRVAR